MTQRSDGSPEAIRLLLVNPNITAAATDRMVDVARRVAAPTTRIEAVSAPSGLAFVRTAAEIALAGEAVARLLMRRRADFDAAIVAAFSDPGVTEARSHLAQPVVGIAEASLSEAAAAHERFSVVTIGGAEQVVRVHTIAEQAGIAPQRFTVRVVAAPFGDIASNPKDFHADFAAMVRRTVEEDCAGAVVIGGGPLAGLAERLAEECRVPVLDGVCCAVRCAERLVRANRPDRGQAATRSSDRTGPDMA